MFFSAPDNTADLTICFYVKEKLVIIISKDFAWFILTMTTIYLTKQPIDSILDGSAMHIL